MADYPNNQGNPAGAIPVYIAAGAGAGAVSTQPGPSAAEHIAGAGSATVFEGPGVLGTVVINTGAATSTVTVYDGTDNSGAVLAIIDATLSRALVYNVGVTDGVFIVTTGTADVLVTGYPG